MRRVRRVECFGGIGAVDASRERWVLERPLLRSGLETLIMGGGAAIWAAVEAPELVRGMVMINPFVDGEGNRLLVALLSIMFARPWGPSMWLKYYSSLYPTRKPADFAEYSSALHENIQQHGRLEAVMKMLRASKRASGERMPKVKQPALVLMGSKDPDFKNPEREAKRVADALRGSYAMLADDYSAPEYAVGEAGLAEFWPNNPWYKPYLKDMPLIYYPNVVVSGGGGFGKGSYWYQHPRHWAYSGSMRQTNGMHSRKVGGESRLHHSDGIFPNLMGFSPQTALTANTFINPDTRLTPSFLDELMPAFDDPRVGLAGGKLLQIGERES